jgi:Iap family predicted aminopeptidase
MRNIAIDAISIASDLTRFGEVVAGTSKERQVVEVIKGFIEDYVDRIFIEPVEVLSWNEEFCMIYIDNIPYRCSLHPPYNGYVDLEIGIEDLIFIKEFNDMVKLSKTLEGKIVVVENIDDPNYVAIYAYTLRKLNPVAIVFSDRIDTLRKVVAIDDLISRYSPIPPPRIPAIHIERSTGLKLRSSENSAIHIIAKSCLKPSHGFNILAEVNGRDRDSIYLAAHHDRWFNSLVDDSLGVAVLLSLARSELLSKTIKVNTILTFFTAEEGFPNPLSSFYWLVGSRHHVVKNVEKISSEVRLVVNLDVVYRGRTVFSTSNLFARGLLMKIGIDYRDIEHDSMLFDSFPFTLVGVPSVTIHNYYDAIKDGIYHSTLDNVNLIQRIDVEHVDNIVHNIYTLVKMFQEVHRTPRLTEVIDLGLKTLAKELAHNLSNLDVVFYLYKVFRKFLYCNSKSNTTHSYLLPIIHRVLTSTYIPKSIYRGEEIYERTSYLACLDNVIYLPQGIEMNRDECYRRLLHDLESLTYILRC